MQVLPCGLMFLVLAVLLLCALDAGASAEPAALPLKVSEDGRYFADSRGAPFLLVGDSPWSLLVELHESEIVRYLDDRSKRGFNALIVNLIEHQFCTDPPNTRAGLAPFLKPGDFATPNPAYFDFAHKILKKASDRGLVVWLCPAYLGYNGGDQGWFQKIKASGKAALRNYGRFVGERFRDLPNIVWMLGGDYTPEAADRWTIEELAAGIREAIPGPLMTVHGAPEKPIAVDFAGSPWLNIHATYSYEATLFRPLLEDYRRRPVRPFVMIESTYENEHDAVPGQIRRQAYWAMLSGACGQFLGNSPIWHFDGPGLFHPKTTWEKELDGTGSRDMARLRQVFTALPWHRLVPDTAHRLVTAGYGEGAATVTTAATADKKLAVSYIPFTGTEPRALTVDMRQFAGTVTARWFNPTDGKFTPAAQSSLPNRGSHTFQSPGDNGTATNDWLLILEVP